jgi:signal transduction histidine kinase
MDTLKKQKPLVLYLDDEKHNLTVFSSTFFEFYKVLTAQTTDEARQHLAKHGAAISVIVTDQRLENAGEKTTGVAFLQSILNEYPEPVRIVFTGNDYEAQSVIETINKGHVYSYVKKPLMNDDDLKVAIDGAITVYNLQQHNALLVKELKAANESLEQKVQERTRELAEKNERLIELDNEKNEFLGIVAHDLKNPLSNIKMLSKVLHDEYNTMEPEEVREYASHILRASEQMFLLISNLLDINQIERGGLNFTLTTFDLSAVARSVAENYRGRAEAKDITLHISDEGAANVYADPSATYQVLDNLVSNAVKYSPKGKAIYVSVSRNGSAWRFAVKDEGQGLTDDDKKKLFGKFARLSARPTGDEHSTGLGLSIVKRMVEGMNGKVWCESEYGKGATFLVELPTPA